MSRIGLISRKARGLISRRSESDQRCRKADGREGTQSGRGGMTGYRASSTEKAKGVQGEEG